MVSFRLARLCIHVTMISDLVSVRPVTSKVYNFPDLPRSFLLLPSDSVSKLMDFALFPINLGARGCWYGNVDLHACR